MNLAGVIEHWTLILCLLILILSFLILILCLLILIFCLLIFAKPAGKTSALTMNLAGVIKDWLLIYLSAMIFMARKTLPLLILIYCSSRPPPSSRLVRRRSSMRPSSDRRRCRRP